MATDTKTYMILGGAALVVVLLVLSQRGGSSKTYRGAASLVPVSGGNSNEIASAERIAQSELRLGAFNSILEYAGLERGLMSSEYTTKLQTRLANKEGRRSYNLSVFQTQSAERIAQAGIDAQNHAADLQAAAQKRASIFGFIGDLFAPFADLFKP